MNGYATFVPPKPVPGCIPTCLVCNPMKAPTDSPQKWAENLARWAEQQRSPFVLYKLVKPLEEGGVRDPTPEELYAVEQGSLLANEWISTATDRGWVKTAVEVMRKISKCKDIKLLSTPVPLDLVRDYTTVIFHLQDLGSIEAALKENGFAGPDDWINAVRTVFRNATVYNKEDFDIGSMILAAAEAGSNVFEKEMLRLKGITVV